MAQIQCLPINSILSKQTDWDEYLEKQVIYVTFRH